MSLQEQVNEIAKSTKPNLEKFIELRKLYTTNIKAFQKLNLSLLDETGLTEYIAFSPEVRDYINEKRGKEDEPTLLVDN